MPCLANKPVGFSILLSLMLCHRTCCWKYLNIVQKTRSPRWTNKHQLAAVVSRIADNFWGSVLQQRCFNDATWLRRAPRKTTTMFCMRFKQVLLASCFFLAPFSVNFDVDCYVAKIPVDHQSAPPTRVQYRWKPRPSFPLSSFPQDLTAADRLPPSRSVHIWLMSDLAVRTSASFAHHIYFPSCSVWNSEGKFTTSAG